MLLLRLGVMADDPFSSTGEFDGTGSEQAVPFQVIINRAIAKSERFIEISIDGVPFVFS
jgi:hypothetical protein